MGTVSHRGLSFSELGVLMSTPSSEKDSLLRLPVPMKIAPKFLQKEVFFVTPFTRGRTPYCSDFGIGYASTVDTHTDIGLLDDLFNKDKKL